MSDLLNDNDTVNDSTDTCPISSAIRTIRGGFYAGREEHDDMRVVVIGGGSKTNASTFVCDDVAYYITRRRLEFARYELSQRNGGTVPAPHVYTSMMLGEIAAAIINDLPMRLHDQLVSICDIISRMEDLIQRRVLTNANSANISLCSLCNGIFTRVDPRELFNTTNAYTVVNAVVDHMRGNDINVLLTSPCTVQLATVPEFTMTAPTWTDIANDESEMIVAEYLRNVEGYHCELIACLGSVHARCDEILSKLR